MLGTKQLLTTYRPNLLGCGALLLMALRSKGKWVTTVSEI